MLQFPTSLIFFKIMLLNMEGRRLTLCWDQLKSYSVLTLVTQVVECWEFKIKIKIIFIKKIIKLN
jgi:hypothetical protein